METESVRAPSIEGESLELPPDYLLRSERLQLRPPLLEDTEALWPHVTDPRVTHYLAWDPHQSKNVTAGMLRSLIAAQTEGKSYHWVVIREGEVLGIISLIDVWRAHRCWTLNRAELAYWLGVPFQGHGYATEAARRILHFAFHELGLHKVIISHVITNPASGAVAQRLGFRCVGDEREAFLKDGQWHDLRRYEILERQFFAAEAMQP